MPSFVFLDDGDGVGRTLRDEDTIDHICVRGGGGSPIALGRGGNAADSICAKGGDQRLRSLTPGLPTIVLSRDKDNVRNLECM